MTRAANALRRSKLGLARLALARARAGKPGDFAVLKAQLLGAKPTPEIAEKLNDVKGYCPPIDLDALARLPEGAFGRAYADWMRGRGLTPIEASPDIAAIAEENPFALRYAITHDMIHVLTGFDTSLAGEMGVLAFAEAQGYSTSQGAALAVASLVYPLLKPWKTTEILRARRRGRDMGRNAAFLLGERLEERFDQPLDAVRRDLGLTKS